MTEGSFQNLSDYVEFVCNNFNLPFQELQESKSDSSSQGTPPREALGLVSRDNSGAPDEESVLLDRPSTSPNLMQGEETTEKESGDKEVGSKLKQDDGKGGCCIIS